MARRAQGFQTELFVKLARSHVQEGLIMRKRLSVVFPLLILLAGLALIMYPRLSDWWNSYHQSRAIIHYAEEVSDMDEAEKAGMWESAEEYNEKLTAKAPHWLLTKAEWADYESQLDVTGTGIMGYVEIPRIKCSLPIYHGTEDSVLSAGIGHIEGSSLPIGGENTHCILSGHRGLPSAKLLTDLDKMEEGDVFYLHVLEETLAYKVDKINTVEPDDLKELEIQEGQDLCTLVTCTPYGINSHRLLVRGHRIAIMGQAANDIMQEMQKPQPSVWTLILKLVVLPAILIIVILTGWRIYRKKTITEKR